MKKIYLLLGSNIGNRFKNIEKAKELVESKIGKISKKSKIYETEPWGEKEQDNFLNQAIEVDSKLKPKALMKQIGEIEQFIGREETYKWGPREIDIDVLFYGDEMISEVDITIPHAFIHERLFTLIPLKDICPNKLHPIFGATVTELIDMCEDNCEVLEFKEED